jgi:hypothetical protein
MFVTLSSDSSKQFFADNTVAHFSSVLTKPICATPSEVAVVEVFLPPFKPSLTSSPIFLYTDVIKPVAVSDTDARLLRVLTPFTMTGHHEFTSSHYLPVEKQNFTSITLSFRTKTGEKYDFPSGSHPSIVVLHFRDVQ